MTIRTDGTGKESIVDTGSPVTMIPPDEEIINDGRILPVTTKHQDGKSNEPKLTGKIRVKTEKKRMRTNLSKLITAREHIKPLLCMHWLREFNWTIRHIEKTTTPTDQTERDEIITQIQKLFKRSRTIRDTEVKILLKSGHLPTKKKIKTIPYHLENFVQKEINNLIESRQLEKVKTVDEECFVSPVVITLKKDCSV